MKDYIKMVTKSIQTTGHSSQIKGDRIVLFLKCVKCNKGRVYLINDNLKLLLNKETSSLGFEVECEGCKNVIYAGIGYIPEGLGFSYTEPDFLAGQGFQVLDENGLQDLD